MRTIALFISIFAIFGAIDFILYISVPLETRETYNKKLRQLVPGSGIYIFFKYKFGYITKE